MMQIRTANAEDAPAITAMLQDLVAVGKRTSSADELFVLNTYIANPAGILCSVAVGDKGAILGLQSLIRATEGNPYGTPVGWSIIGTHVSPSLARRGVGSRLFEVTKSAAIAAGIHKIEACIGLANLDAQAFYERLGFRTNRETEEAICKLWSS